MSLKQMMEDDLSIFYSTDAFGLLASSNSNEFIVIFADDYEIETLNAKVVTAMSNTVTTLNIEDTITIEGKYYTVQNIASKDEYDLEKVIGIVKND